MQDFTADPEKYDHHLVPLPPSKPKIPIEEILKATKPIKPFPWNKQTDMSVSGGGGLFGMIGKLFTWFR